MEILKPVPNIKSVLFSNTRDPKIYPKGPVQRKQKVEMIDSNNDENNVQLSNNLT